MPLIFLFYRSMSRPLTAFTFLLILFTSYSTLAKAYTADAIASKHLITQIPALAPTFKDDSSLETYISSDKTNKLGTTVVVFKQRYNGIDVYAKSGKVLLNSKDKVVSSRLDLSTYKPLAHFSPLTSPYDPFAHAIERAFLSLGIDVFVDPKPVLATDNQAISYRDYTVSTLGSRFQVDKHAKQVAKRVWVDRQRKLVPAYQIMLNYLDRTANEQFSYSVIVADENAVRHVDPILATQNLTRDFGHAYHVFSASNGSPIGNFQGAVTAYQPLIDVNPEDLDPRDIYTFQPESQNTQQLAHGPISTGDAWLTQEVSRLMGLSGNNVIVCVPSESLSQATLTNNCQRPGWTSVLPSSTGAFDWVYNPQDPTSEQSRRAAATNIFYLYNWLHDYFYDLGFDELSGNSQVLNYGRGGEENDPLIVYLGNNDSLRIARYVGMPDGMSPNVEMSFSPTPELLKEDEDYGIRFSITFDPDTEFEFSDEYNISAAPSFVGQQAFGTLGRSEYTRVSLNIGSGCEALAHTDDVKDKIVIYPLVDESVVDRFAEPVCDPFNPNSQMYDNLAQLKDSGAKGVIFGISTFFVSQYRSRPPLFIGRNDALPHLFSDIRVLTALLGEQQSCTEFPDACINPKMELYSLKASVNDPAIGQVIAIHEWAHHLTGRLRARVAIEASAQERALSEGWSDFVAVFFNLKEAHRHIPGNEQFQGMYNMSDLAFPDPYFGPRRAPYSTDLSRNSLMFNDISEANPFPESVPSSRASIGFGGFPPHVPGEIWAVALLEAYVALLNDVDRLSFEQAQTRMMSYMITGLKIQGSPLTFLTAKEAILTAAYANDINDYRLMNAAFAKRGMGARAIAPAFDSIRFEGAIADTETEVKILSFEPFVSDADTGTSEVDSIQLTYDVNYTDLPNISPSSMLTSFASKNVFFSCDANGALEQFEFGVASLKIKNAGDLPLDPGAVVMLFSQGNDNNIIFENDGVVILDGMAPFETIMVNVPFVFTGDQVNQALTLSASLQSEDANLELPNPVSINITANQQQGVNQPENDTGTHNPFCESAKNSDLSVLSAEQLTQTINNITINPSVMSLSVKASDNPNNIDQVTQSISISNTGDTRRHFDVSIRPNTISDGIEYRLPREVHVAPNKTRTFDARMLVRRNQIDTADTPLVNDGFIIVSDSEHRFEIPYRFVVTP